MCWAKRFEYLGYQFDLGIAVITLGYLIRYALLLLAAGLLSAPAFAASAIAFHRESGAYFGCAKQKPGDAARCAVIVCEKQASQACELVLVSKESNKGWNALVRHSRGVIPAWGLSSKDEAIDDAMTKCMNKFPDQKCKFDLAFFDNPTENGNPIQPEVRKPDSIARRPMEQGTGFLVDRSGFLVTNAHVVSGSNVCDFVPDNASRGKATIVARDAGLDLAVLKTNRPLNGAATLAATAPVKGQKVYAIGYPLQDQLARELNITNGIVNALRGIAQNETRLQHSAPIQPGNSGGPLIDSEGNVVGVNVAVLKTGQLKERDIAPQNVNFAIKTIHLANLMKSHQIPFAMANGSGKEIPGETLARDAENFVFKLECFK